MKEQKENERKEKKMLSSDVLVLLKLMIILLFYRKKNEFYAEQLLSVIVYVNGITFIVVDTLTDFQFLLIFSAHSAQMACR